MNTLKDSIKEIERKEIINALQESDWIMTRAALKGSRINNLHIDASQI